MPDFDVVFAELSEDPISVDLAIAAVEGDEAGQWSSFSGVVRNHDGGKAVDRLSYTAHPTAQQILADVVAELVAEHSGEASSLSASGPPTGSGCSTLAIPHCLCACLPPTAARLLPCAHSS